jgi:hypothetical protein
MRTPKPAKPAASQEYRKPRADVYTVLLFVAVAMLAIGAAALWMLMKEEYNNEIKGGPNPVWHRPASGTTFDPHHEIA